ncbi:HNH endonuclease signature motif containing protein [Aeromicrobium terrae]|nr:HNH endonuclease signature motif containing protein [Aeromicrobium terrae]
MTDLARAAARAEFALWSGQLEYSIAEEAAIDAADLSPLAKQARIAMIAMEIGTSTGLSEGQVRRRLSIARDVRERAPQTWLAFRKGRIDAARVTVISDGMDKLKRDESVMRLDQRVVAYAETHTTAELRQWVRRFVARVEADLVKERAEDERAKRAVHVEHVDDGMAWLNIYTTSLVAAAVDKRLNREAKAFGADDERTAQQRRADLAAAWLTTNEAGEAAIGADVAVTISADALAGVNDDPIVAADGSWTGPAGWIKDLAGSNTLWHRIITDAAGKTLDHTYLGRFAPEVVTKAIAFRDGVCQAPGCTRPSAECDIDHRVPHPAGLTSGRNLWPLCRRHHQLKGHEVLHWMLPSGRVVPAERVAHSPPIADASHAEHELATFLVD